MRQIKRNARCVSPLAFFMACAIMNLIKRNLDEEMRREG